MKKTTKRNARRDITVPTYSKLEIMMSSSTEPMPLGFRTHQLNRMNGGLHAMRTAAAPTHDDWRVVSDAVNLMETIVEFGWAEDAEGLIGDAIAAMAAAGQRSLAGQPLRLDGPGLKAVQAVLLDYEAVLNAASERNMKLAHAATERRIYDIRRGRTRKHDVKVTSI